VLHGKTDRNRTRDIERYVKNMGEN
jgi:hypothetical protein